MEIFCVDNYRWIELLTSLSYLIMYSFFLFFFRSYLFPQNIWHKLINSFKFKIDEAKAPNNSVYNGLEWSEFGRVKSSLSKLKIGNVYFSLLHERLHEGRAKSSKTINVDSTFIRVKSTYHQLLSASECIADGGRAVRAWLNIERIMGHLSKVTCRFFPVRIILIHASLAWPLFWSTLSNRQPNVEFCQKYILENALFIWLAVTSKLGQISTKIWFS